MKIRLRIGTLIVLALTAHMLMHAEVSVGQSRGPDQPRVVNVKLETRAITAPLQKEFRILLDRADVAQWIGYAVPEISGNRNMCCGNYSEGVSDCGRCALETNDHGTSMSSSGRQSTALEGSQQLSILFRVEHSRVDKIRVFSMDCELDAGGRALIWLTGVHPAESVALLSGYVTSGADLDEHDGNRISNRALTAIALHTDPSADRMLESFVAANQPEALRKHASFWLGAARGKAGLAALSGLAHSDPSPEVRSHVAFAFSVSHESGAVDEMIRMAHDDSSEHVRGQALFWLAHKAGKKAVGAINEAIANDPATSVKKKAVFALSQLPKDEGVPKLIEVARNNRNPVVRKQAMFWLGQSHDPRALAFFEEVLSH